MTTRVVCPHCGEKLVLRKPAMDSTKVKCGICRGKFYAGHSDGTQRITVSDDTALSQALVDTPPPMLVERRRVSVSVPVPVESPGPAVPAWLVPVGLVVLVGLTIAGINSRPAVAPPPTVNQPTTVVGGNATTAPVSP